MVSLVYISSAVVPFTDLQLIELLAQSRVNNTQAGITGMLVYKDGNFMQLIEGDEAAVDALQVKIRKDPRHCGMITLLRQPITERQFDGWSMGFRNLHSPEVHAMEGFSAFLNHDLTGKEFQENPSLAQKLLLSFKKNM
jgi:hypothetical protein